MKVSVQLTTLTVSLSLCTQMDVILFPLNQNKNDYGQISSAHIIPLGIAKISFHFISLFHCDLRDSTVCKFIVKRRILLYQDYFD